jgi:4-amino-4-deoxy-L-arabinose transferase-like glycosyltransferase
MNNSTYTCYAGNTAGGLIPYTSSSHRWYRIMTSQNHLLAAIVFASVAIKILFALADPVINVDGVLYIAAAKQIAAKDFRAALEIYSMPFYPLLIALMHILVNDWVWAARIISIITMVSAIFPLYLITRELFNRQAALWACLVFALVPLPNEWAMAVIRDPAFLFCFAWSVFFCICVITRKKISYCFVSVIFAWAALLFRIEGIILFPVVFFMFVGFLIREREKWRFWLGGIGVWFVLSFLAGGVLIGIAFLNDTVSLNRLDEVGREMENIGRLDFLENYHALYGELKNLEGTPPFSTGNQNILAVTRHYMPVIYMLGVLENMIRVLFPIFMIPLFRGFSHTWERHHTFIWCAVSAHLLIVYYSLINRDFLEIRFIFAPVFLMYPWVGNGLDGIWVKVRKRTRSRLLVFVFLMLFIVMPLYKTGNNIFPQDTTLREAGQWLAKNPEFTDTRLATTDSRIPFYADKEGESFLYTSDRKTINFYMEFEKMALQNKAELVAEKVKRGREPFKNFDHYRIVKTFKGKINFVHIYQLVPD